MTNQAFKFYSVLKNEDANPYIDDNILVVADGLGGSGCTVHSIDRTKHLDMHGDIIAAAFGDLKDMSQWLMQYIEELIAPMVDGKDDTSALWASRIVIARCVYALTEGEFKKADLSDKKVRDNLAKFIELGLHNVADKFNLQKGEYDGQLLLPTTLAFMRYTEDKRKKHSVIVETVWAGDSRCYALTPNGLKLLSVDDEDSSGSITNLFYADNDKVKLNYIRHEIAKPCALLAVSDGVFDPFDPHENLGVEHTLLSAIKANNTYQEVATALYDLYGSIHGDDATMAFVSIGFNNFKDMQKKLQKRTDEILSVRKKQSELHGALEVMNQSEEEVSHYVLSRTNDKYDYIVSMLVDAIESGTADIALSPEIRKIAETVKNNRVVSVANTTKQNTEQAMSDLYNYVSTHPECVSHYFVEAYKVDFGYYFTIQDEFAALRNNAAIYVEMVNKDELKTIEPKCMEEFETLHQKIMERINFYRAQFDALWKDRQSDYQLRYDTNIYLRVWQNIDFDLQYNWRVSDIGKLPNEDMVLACEVSDFIDKYRVVKKQINELKSKSEWHYHRFVSNLNIVCNFLTEHPDKIKELLTAEATRRFGLDGSNRSFVAERGESNRSKILAELNAKKADIVFDIVKALAENYDKTSLIDGQYNGTKLQLFRTYFRMKASDMGDLENFEAHLATIEKAYTELISDK